MQPPRKYMAASVPRFLRTARLSYLPMHTIIGSRHIENGSGAHLVFDIIMLEPFEFQRMRSNVGLQHVAAPALKAGPTFAPSFILTDVKEIVVPTEESDPRGYAKAYFLLQFGITTPKVAGNEPLSQSAKPSLNKKETSFSKIAKEHTSKDQD